MASEAGTRHGIEGKIEAVSSCKTCVEGDVMGSDPGKTRSLKYPFMPVNR